MPARIEFPLSNIPPARAIDSDPRHTTTVVWPEAIFAYLDALVDEASSGTNRQELAAALIASAPRDRTELRERLDRFRDGKVRDLGKAS
jgi:hypothetical protein